MKLRSPAPATHVPKAAESAAAVRARLDRDQTRHLARKLAQLARPYRARMLGASLLIVLYALTILAGPFLVKLAIDHGIAERNGRTLNVIVVVYVVIAIAAWAIERAQIRIVSRLGESFLRDLRVQVFDHLQKLSMPFYDREKSGVLVARMTADIDAMEDLVQQGMILILTNTVLLAVAVVVLAVVSWQLLLVCLIPVPLVVIATVKFQRDSAKSFLRVRDWIGLTLTSLQEGISGIRVVQAFTREETQLKQFSRSNRGLYEEYMHSVWISCWYLPIIEFAGLFTTALVIGFGGILTLHGAVTIGTVGFFVLSLSNLFDPIQQLSQYFNQVQSSSAGLVKLVDLLDESIEVPSARRPIALSERGVIEVRDLWFGYGTAGANAEPETFALRNVNLTIAAGERLALVGPTGAGKSTLAKLIARLYDPVRGAVTFDGVDLRDTETVELRRRICVVPQEGFLFDGTIIDNIRLALPSATDAQIETAMENIGVIDRFKAFPEGLHTEVHERGSRLSAGEKQLVSLARAALADPAVLVLDEATSSLDPGTEAIVEDALERLMTGRTVIVIAHRLSTSERTDRVGVVAGGELVELGSHDELVALGGHYASLYATWIRSLGRTV